MIKLKIRLAALVSLGAAFVLVFAFGVASLVQADNWTLQGSNIYNNNAGGVGVGTSTPSGMFVVQPASDSTNAIQFLNSAGTSIVDIDSTHGRMGVGTVSPSYPLDVQSASGTNAIVMRVATNNAASGTTTMPVLILSNLNSSESQTMQFSFGGTALNGQTQKQFTVAGGSGESLWQFNDNAGNNAVEILQTNDTAHGHGVLIKGLAGQTSQVFGIASSSGTSLVTVTAAGNVGVNTSSPDQALDVAGNVELTGNIVSNGDICIGTCP